MELGLKTKGWVWEKDCIYNKTDDNFKLVYPPQCCCGEKGGRGIMLI